MSEQIRLTIDGVEVLAEEGQNLLRVARDNGFEVPGLCYHPRISVTGACRLCVVKIAGRPGTVTSCTVPVAEGLEVTAFDDELESMRRMLIDLLLSEHNCDCLTCEFSGACELQELAYQYGLDNRERRFASRERILPDPDTSSPVLDYDASKCIVCARCIKACEEVQGKGVLSYAHRGLETVVVAGLGEWGSSECDGCGECVQLCPTGAILDKLTERPPRVWETKRVQTTCSYCGVGCQLDMWTAKGRVVRVRGSEAVPNYGSTCVKGRFGHTFMTHDERLTSPLVRRNGTLEPATWDEAMDEITKRLVPIKEQHGADAIVGLSSARCTNEENYLFQKMMRAAVGTNNVDHCARLCHASTVAGLAAAFGSGAMTNSIGEIEFAKCILVTGSNTTETHPVIATLIRRAVREHGAKLIVVDPRRIDLVKDATLWLRQKNGTDVAWLNGMMNVILSEGLEDKAFVAERTEEFEAFKAVISEYTPERVEDITSIPADAIREAARIYAEAECSSIIYSMGITQHTTGTDNVLSVANLALLTGNVGKASAGVNPLRGQNNVQGACDLGALSNVYPGYQKVTDPAMQEKFETAWGAKLSPTVGLTVVEAMNAAAKGTVKAMIIMGENPMVSDPNLNHVEEALRNLDFLVVSDIFPSETAQLADVVLPAASFAEKEGTFTNTERRVLLLREVLDAPGEALPDWEIICRISERFGYPMHYESAAEIMDEAAKVTPIYGGMRHDRLVPNGLQWPCPDDGHPGTVFLHGGKFSRGLGRFHPVDFVPPAELPDDEYPFILSTGRILYHYHTGTMSRRVDALNAYVDEGYAEVHPDDARQLGLEDGGWVSVRTRRGEITTRVRATERVAPGSVFVPFHFAEAAANRLTNDALDPKAKIPEYKVAACQIEKAARRVRS
jgi:formate dehydrogenase alpha subunit